MSIIAFIIFNIYGYNCKNIIIIYREKMEDLSYYEILEVSQSADKTTIKKAYRTMAY